jgi:hypothetical protein
MKKSLITFLLLFNDLKYGKNSLFVEMITVMQFLQFFFYESQVKELRKAFTKEKNNFKVLMTVLLLFYYFFMT